MIPTVDGSTKNRYNSLKFGISAPRVPNADMDKPECKYCNGRCVKAGKERSGKQRYRCTICNRRQVAFYDNLAYSCNIDENIIALTKEGVGIRGTARLLSISPTTLLSKIKKIAKNINEPILVFGKEYEVDELRTFIKKKVG